MVQIYPSNPCKESDYLELLYVNHFPTVELEKFRQVTVGGTAANLQELPNPYPSGVTPHVHLQIWKNDPKHKDGRYTVDPTSFFSFNTSNNKQT